MSTEDIEFGSLNAGPDATTVSEDTANRLYKYYTQLDPTVFDNISSAIQNPFQKAAQNTLFGGESGDTAITAETLLQFKNLYKPEELNSIVDSYVEQTGDKETGAILKNLFGSDTTLSDTAIAEAKKIPLGEGDITTAGYTEKELNKIGSDAVKPDTTKPDTTKPKTGLEALPDSLKYLAMLAAAKLAYDDAERARQEARGWSAPGGVAKQMVRGPSGGVSYRKVGKAAGGIASLAGGGNVIGEKSASTPYQVYDKASDTYRYVDAAGYEKWLNGIPLTPTNRVQGSPVYYGAPSKAEGDYDIGGNNPITMQDNSLDIQDFDESFNDKTFTQAFQNDLYAPEGLIANEVVNRAVEEFPYTFDARNIALRNERDAMMRNATNQFLGDVMSVDQITGDIDPIQSLKNIAAYEPSTVGAAPGISGLVSYMRGLDPTSEQAQKGFGASYIEQLSPEDIRDIRSGGNNYRNVFGAIADVLENRYILPEDYSDSQPPIIKSKPPSEMGITGGGGGKRGGVVHRPHYAAGGMTTKQPFYLGGPTDGMADKIPAHIDNERPAALSDGEFVIPADVVSHLGNGNSNAGAKRLYEMMDRIREARTGNKNQGVQINPNKFMPR